MVGGSAPSEPSVLMMSCSVCDTVCPRSEELTYHHLTHSVLELARALTVLQIRLLRLDDTKLDGSLTIKQESLAVEVDGGGNPHKEERLEETLLKAKKRKKNKSGSLVPSSRAPHTCTICRSVLSSRGALTKHMITHQDKKPFQCEECNQSFNQSRDLKTHTMQRHSGQRPHVCGICGKGFVHKFYLMEHMTYHTGERQFQCCHCGKRFQAQSALSKHIKRHTTTKDFSCDICPKAFAVKTDLKSHVKLVHEKPACNKGIPAEPVKIQKTDIKYKQTEELVKQEDVENPDGGDKDKTWIVREDKNEDWRGDAEDESVARRSLETSHLEEWMFEQGVKLSDKEVTSVGAPCCDSAVPVPQVYLPPATAPSSHLQTVDDHIPSVDRSPSIVSRPSQPPYIPNVPKL